MQYKDFLNPSNMPDIEPNFYQSLDFGEKVKNMFKSSSSFENGKSFFRKNGIHVMTMLCQSQNRNIFSLILRLLQHATLRYDLNNMEDILGELEHSFGLSLNQILTFELELIQIAEKSKNSTSKGDAKSYCATLKKFLRFNGIGKDDNLNNLNDIILRELCIMVSIAKVIKKHLDKTLKLDINIIDMNDANSDFNFTLICLDKKEEQASTFNLQKVLIFTNSVKSVTFTQLKSLYRTDETYIDAIIEDIIVEQDLYQINLKLLNKQKEEKFKMTCERLLEKMDKIDSVGMFLKEIFESLMEIDSNSDLSDNLVRLGLIASFVKDGNGNCSSSFKNNILSKLKQTYEQSLEDSVKNLIEKSIASYFEELRGLGTEQVEAMRETEELKKKLKATDTEIAKVKQDIELQKKDLNAKKSEDEILSKKILQTENELEEKQANLVRIKNQIFFQKIISNLQSVTLDYSLLSNFQDFLKEVKNCSTFENLLVLINSTFELEYQIPKSGGLSLDEKTKRLNQCKDILEHLFPMPNVQRISSSPEPILEVTGGWILYSQVKDDVEKFLEKYPASEVHFIAAKKFYLDSDLKNEHWHGTNLVVRTSNIEVTTSVAINTSGLDGAKHEEQRAEGGAYGSRYGGDGEPGRNGENAGHIYLISSKDFLGADLLTIFARGGNGSDGQSGGHGKNGSEGSDGHDGKAEEPPNGYYAYDEPYGGSVGDDGGAGGSGGAAGLGGDKGKVIISNRNEQVIAGSIDAKVGTDGRNGCQGIGGIGGIGGLSGLVHHLAYKGNMNEVGPLNLRWFGGEWISKKGNYSPRYGKNLFGNILNCDLIPENSDPTRRTRLANGEKGRDGDIDSTQESKVSKSAIDENSIERKYDSLKNAFGSNVQEEEESIVSAMEELKKEEDDKETLIKSKQRARQNKEALEKDLARKENDFESASANSSKHQMKQKNETKDFEKLQMKQKGLEKDMKHKESKREKEISGKQKILSELERLFKNRREQKVTREEQTTRIIPLDQDYTNPNSNYSNANAKGKHKPNIQAPPVNESDWEFITQVFGEDSKDKNLVEALTLGLFTIKRFSRIEDPNIANAIPSFLSQYFTNRQLQIAISKSENNSTNTLAKTETTLLSRLDYLRDELPLDVYLSVQIENQIKTKAIKQESISQIYEILNLTKKKGFMDNFKWKKKHDQNELSIWNLLFTLRSQSYKLEELKDFNKKVFSQIKPLNSVLSSDQTESKSNTLLLLIFRHIQTILRIRLKEKFLSKISKRAHQQSSVKIPTTANSLITMGEEHFRKMEMIVSKLKNVEFEIEKISEIDIFLGVEIYLDLIKDSKADANLEDQFWNDFLLKLTKIEDVNRSVVQKILNLLDFKFNIHFKSEGANTKLSLVHFLLEHLHLQSIQELDILNEYLESFMHTDYVNLSLSTKSGAEKARKIILGRYVQQWQNTILVSINKKMKPLMKWTDFYTRIANAVNTLILMIESPYSIKSFESRLHDYNRILDSLEDFHQNNPILEIEGSSNLTKEITELCTNLEANVTKNQIQNPEFLTIKSILEEFFQQQPHLDDELDKKMLLYLKKLCQFVQFSRLDQQQITQVEELISNYISGIKVTNLDTKFPEWKTNLSNLLRNLYKKQLQSEIFNLQDNLFKKDIQINLDKQQILNISGDILENASGIWDPKKILQSIELNIEALSCLTELLGLDSTALISQLKFKVEASAKKICKLSTSKHMLQTISQFLKDEFKKANSIVEKQVLDFKSEYYKTDIVTFFSGITDHKDKYFNAEEIKKLRSTCLAELISFILSLQDRCPVFIEKEKEDDDKSQPQKKYFIDTQEIANVQKTVQIFQTQSKKLTEENEIPQDLIQSLEFWFCLNAFGDMGDMTNLIQVFKQLSLHQRKSFQTVQESIYKIFVSEIDQIFSIQWKFQQLKDSSIKMIRSNLYTQFVQKATQLIKNTLLSRMTEEHLESYLTQQLNHSICLIWEEMLQDSGILNETDKNSSSGSIKNLIAYWNNFNAKISSTKSSIEKNKVIISVLSKILMSGSINETTFKEIENLYKVVDTAKKSLMNMDSSEVSFEDLLSDYQSIILKLGEISLIKQCKPKGLKLSKYVESCCFIVAKTSASIFPLKSKSNAINFQFEILQKFQNSLTNFILNGKCTLDDLKSKFDLDCFKTLTKYNKTPIQNENNTNWGKLLQTAQLETNNGICFGILLLQNNFCKALLHPSEVEFLNQTLSNSSNIDWKATEEQKMMFRNFLSTLNSKISSKFNYELKTNRILEIILNGMDKGTKVKEISFLSSSEQFYLDEIQNLKEMDGLEIKTLLIQSMPSEWNFKLKQKALDTLFDRMTSNLINDQSNNEKDLEKLRHFFNRSYFFCKTEDEEGWFILMKFVTLQLEFFPLRLDLLTNFLNILTQLGMFEVKGIVKKFLPNQWAKETYRILVQSHFLKLIIKKNEINYKSVDIDKGMAKWNVTIEKLCKADCSANAESILSILNAKLSLEIQLTDLSTVIEPLLLQNLVDQLASKIDLTCDSILDKLRKQPFSLWGNILSEQELLVKYDKSLVDAMFKTSSVTDLEIIKNFVQQLFKKFGENNKSEEICKILEAISTANLILDNEIFLEIHSNIDNFDDLSEVRNKLDSYSKAFMKKIRTPKELLRLMRQDKKNDAIKHLIESTPDATTKTRIEAILKETGNWLNKPSGLFKENKLEIQKWAKEDIQQWTNSFKLRTKNERLKLVGTEEDSVSTLTEILAVIGQALYIVSGGKRVWNVQLMAIIILLDGGGRKKGRLAEISTGEGKTYITAMVAAIKVLCGSDVDVVTSSPVLAIENAREMTPFFECLGITANNNCDLECEKNEKIRGSRYQNNLVIYGDVSSFQRDLLLTRFFAKNITKGRTAGVVIIDEVDSMLLDKGENILYLSHNIPDLKHLRPLLIELWQATHAPDVYKGTKSDMAMVSNYINRRMERKEIKVPNHLKGFVQRRLPVWIRNAYLAEWMNENDPYILADRSNGGRQVVIVDKATGVEQTQMHWSNGLHQFLQLKHMDKLSSESLKAVFISNLSYFKEFSGKIYGITGTLGSDIELSLLTQSYDVDYFTLPRKTAQKCIQHKEILCASESEWLKQLRDITETLTKKEGRSVLIVSETVESVNKIALQMNNSLVGEDKIYVYKSSFDEEFLKKFGQEQLLPGQVIIATNLAGRGTDLKINEQLKENGGLHVILSYMPSNLRIEKQAFGRTARAGQPGTVQFILHQSDPEMKLSKLKRLRDEEEGSRIELFRTRSLQTIEMEEKLCARFTKLFNTIKSNLEEELDENASTARNFLNNVVSIDTRPPKHEKKYVELQLEFLKNRWALWLDSMGEKIKLLNVTGDLPIFKKFQNFHNEMLKIQYNSKKNGFMFAAGPTELIQLGRYFETSELLQNALECYDTVIVQEPRYAEVAHYYKAAVLLKREPEKGKKDAMSHLKLTRKALDERMNELEISNEILKVTDQLRRESGKSSLANRYETQVKNEMKILHTFHQSISEALGQNLDAQTFTSSHGVLDSEEGTALFEELRRNKAIIKNYRISKKVQIGNKNEIQMKQIDHESLIQWKNIEVPKRFDSYIGDVANLLKKKIQAKQLSIEQVEFEEVVLTSKKLWSLLQDHEIITNVIQTKTINVNYNEDKFTELKFPEELDQYKPLFKRLLESQNGDEFNTTSLDSLIPLTTMKYIQDFLLNSKFLKEKDNVKGTLDSQKHKLNYNKSLEKIESLPKDLEMYNLILQQSIISWEGVDLDSTNEIKFKSELSLEDIPLEIETNVACGQIFRYLSTIGVIKGVKVNFPLFSSEEKMEEMKTKIEQALNESKELKEIHKKFHIANQSTNLDQSQKEKLAKEYIANISTTVSNSIGTLKRFPKVEISYNQLDLYFMGGEYPPEIEEYESSLFSDVMSLSQKTSRWSWGAFCVAMFGIVQIIAGILLIYYTGGLLANVGMALIGEGAGDIFFAVDSGLRTNFSWKGYAAHKAISLTISVLSFGIGCYFSGAATVTQGAMGGMQLLKFIGTIATRQIIRQAGFAMLNVGIEYSMDKLRQQLMQSFKTQLTGLVEEQASAELNKLEEKMNKIYEASYEPGQAEKVIREALNNVLGRRHESDLGQQIMELAKQLIFISMGTIKQNLPSEGSGKLNLILSGLSIVAEISEAFKVISHIQELANLAPKIVEELSKELDRKECELKNRHTNLTGTTSMKNSPADFQAFKQSFKSTVKVDIVNEIMTEIQYQYVQPAAQALAHGILIRIQELVESGTKKILKGIQKSLADNTETQRLVDFKQDSSNENKDGDNQKEGMNPEGEDSSEDSKIVKMKDLDSKAKVMNKDGKEISVSELKSRYGENVPLYEKNGRLYYDLPDYDQYVKDTTKLNAQSGDFQIEMLAKQRDVTVEVVDETGQIISTFNQGKDKVVRMQYSKNANDAGHYAPIVNGQTIHIPQSITTSDSCLYQCFTFYESFDQNDGDIILARQVANDPNAIQQTVDNVVDFAKADPELRAMYMTGNIDIAGGRMGGTAHQGLMFNGKPVYWSQSSVSTNTTEGIKLTDLATDFKKNGFNSDKSKINLVHYPASDGSPEHYISIDNRRLVALYAMDIPLTDGMVNVYDANERIPEQQRGRFKDTDTYSQAVEGRMNKQTPKRPQGQFGFLSTDITINLSSNISSGDKDNFNNTFRVKGFKVRKKDIA